MLIFLIFQCRFVHCQSTPKKSLANQPVPKKNEEVNACNTKINEIECELARLRAQVAQILSLQTVNHTGMFTLSCCRILMPN